LVIRILGVGLERMQFFRGIGLEEIRVDSLVRDDQALAKVGRVLLVLEAGRAETGIGRCEFREQAGILDADPGFVVGGDGLRRVEVAVRAARVVIPLEIEGEGVLGKRSFINRVGPHPAWPKIRSGIHPRCFSASITS